MRWKELLTLRMLEKNKTWISEIKGKKKTVGKKSTNKVCAQGCSWERIETNRSTWWRSVIVTRLCDKHEAKDILSY